MYDRISNNFLLCPVWKDPCLDTNNNNQEPFQHKFNNTSLGRVVLRQDNTIQ